MGRTVTAESGLEKILKRFASAHSSSPTETISTALLIGCTASGSRDHMLDVLPTPALKGEGDGEGGDGDWWVAEHARQVASCLPGGVVVLGLAVVCSTAELKGLQARIRQLLAAVWSSSRLGVDDMLSEEKDGSGTQLLVHYCTQTKRIKCQVVDATNYRIGFQPADLKFQPHTQPLVKLESYLQLTQHSTLCESADSNAKTGRCIKAGMKHIMEAVVGSLATIDGHVPSDSDPLPKTKSRNSSDAVEIRLLARSKPLSSTLPAPCEQHGGCAFNISGGIHCTAYTGSKCSWGEAVKALKQDALRSMIVRCNLILDELINTDDKTPHKEQLVTDQSVPKVVKLPRRVLLSLSPPRAPFLISDYCFPDETDEDVKERMCELWDLDPEQTELSILSCEREAAHDSHSKVSQPPSPDTCAAAAAPTQSTKQVASKGMNSLAVLGVIASLLIALLAVVLWYLLNR